MHLLSPRPRVSRRLYSWRSTSYLAATRHPLPCLLFLLPLLLAYEGAAWWVGGARGEALRNGADGWLRWLVEQFGLGQLYVVPAILVLFFVAWSWRRRHDRPADLVGTCLGMAIESVVFGVLLWAVGRAAGPMLETLRLSVPPSRLQSAWVQVVTFVGAGIYEEVLFRLLAFSALAFLFQIIGTARLTAAVLAAAGSALLFAVAHHVGPYGEPLDGYVFAFRTLAGLYFAGLFQVRGFGVAVGAHAAYDVLVGIQVG